MARLSELPATTLSPYLAQHVDQPVRWWAWGEDALAEARRRDLPIFLSVGYAACHWCHVMAHESFEDPDIAEVLNEMFVPIKVDREERPDLDQLYMAATQLVSGHGGWPMSVFALPDGRPFTAGTYYPPTDRSGQVGFTTLLDAVASAWRGRREEVERQAGAVERALAREIAFVDHLAPRSEPLDLPAIRAALADEIAAATDEDGGSGAPRFPRPSFVEALLAVPVGDHLDAALRILRAMSRGGLFDHLAGGFARYSVDAHWRVPHFEKMLSDQALLAATYFGAARRGGEFAVCAEVARATVDFVLTDLRVEGGFSASLDADAAGVEGSHVTWRPDEVRETLRRAGLEDQTDAVVDYLTITVRGDHEGRSVPRLADGAAFTPPRELTAALDALRDERRQRPQPARDDKVILEWNAMFARALFASRDDVYVREAFDLLAALATSHHRHGHWWRTATGHDFATASDVAWWIDACVDAYEVAGDDAWLERADDAAAYLLEHYWDGPVPSARDPHVGGGVLATSDQCADLFVRPKDVFDGATPSSHAVATRALARVAHCRGDHDLLVVAQRLVELAAELLATHPRAVPDLVAAADFVEGVELVIPGEPNDLSDHVRSLPMWRGVLITGSGTSPLLTDRQPGLAYLCRRGTCRLPVSTVAALRHALDEEI